MATLIQWILRVVIGLMFVVFGGLKLMDPAGFVEDVGNFRIAPFDAAPWDMWLAYGLIGLEIIGGVFLMVPRVFYRGALVLVVGMVGMFMVAIASAWTRGLNVDCGCSGREYNVFGGYGSHLAILMVMLAGLVWLVIEEIFPDKTGD